MAQPIRFVPERLKALREGLGLTQEEFADRVGSTKQAVSSWEQGSYSPSLGSLMQIVNATGAKLDSFFGPANETDKSVGTRR